MLRLSASRRLPICCALLVAFVFTPLGCTKESGNRDASSGGRKFIDVGTAPSGGVFFIMGTALTEVLNEHRGEHAWRVQAKGTSGSQENIRRLDTGELQLGMSNSAITYFGVRGESGWDKPHEVRAVVSLAPNVAMFLARRDSGITKIADLRGRRVIIGPEGAGFEMFVEPILKAHGLTFKDLTVLNAAQSRTPDMLADGQADAAFLGGAVPTPAIRQACDNMDMLLIPFEESARQELISQYPFFYPQTVPMTIKRDGEDIVTYRGMTEDFQGLDVGKMHVITHANVDEELVYQLTKTIWENRSEIAAKHPAGRSINEENAALYTGTPFHPGAERFYKEIGIWSEASEPR